MSFRLVPKSVTLNDLELTLFCVISPNSVASGAHCVKVVEDVVVKSSRSLSHLLTSFLLRKTTKRALDDRCRTNSPHGSICYR